MLRPVILCGGKGVRLWPLSRELYPKQFMELSPGRTLFKDTVTRLSDQETHETIIICNSEHRFMVAEQLRILGANGRIILEPAGRNTAPAVAVAALMADEDDVLLVMPSDHALDDKTAFAKAIERGMFEANNGCLVCFGIVPQTPETGYGYIQKGDNKGEDTFFVKKFIEKPDLVRAEQFVASGNFYWNSGIFMFKAGRYLEELKRYAPAILTACKAAVERAQTEMDFIHLDEEAFSSCPSDSIDYAIMEKADNLCVVAMNVSWSDLGSWDAIHKASDNDEEGNAIVGDVMLRDTKNSYIHSTGHLVVALGLDDFVVIETADAVLVAAKESLKNVKDIVAALTENNRIEAVSHRIVYRPWGSFQTLYQGDRFLVKSIIVKPGEALSLQKHKHRSEHWVVVRGTANVTNGDQKCVLHEDQSIYILRGNAHRLENPGKMSIEIIEVQTGSYLDENDIVRLEDRYNR